MRGEKTQDTAYHSLHSAARNSSWVDVMLMMVVESQDMLRLTWSQHLSSL